MAVATMEPQAMVELGIIKTAMKKIGLGERANDLLSILDELRLDAMLKISEEQEKMGLTVSLEEAERRMKAKFAKGYYGK